MKTKNIIRKAKNLALVVAAGAALSLTGCAENTERVNKTGTFRGYEASIWENGLGKFTQIRGPRYFVTGRDFDDGDSTTVDYYEIRMALPKGHPLRAYANRDSLDKARIHILETGHDW